MRFADASETAYDRAIDTDMPEPDYSESLEVSEPDYEKELLNNREKLLTKWGKYHEKNFNKFYES